MPEDFDRCVAGGGKVRTKTIDSRRYMHICIKDGQTYGGEVKTKKAKGGKKADISKAVMGK